MSTELASPNALDGLSGTTPLNPTPSASTSRTAETARADGRFRSLHAWRGICAIMVAAFHLHTTGFIHNAALIKGSYRFVDFFFVLSGFVIAVTYRERLQNRELRLYLLRRVGRLWPLHIAVLAVLVAVAIAGAQVGLHLDGFNWSALPANILLVQSWDIFDALTWNGPSWSISSEIAAYGVFALAAWVAPGRRLVLVAAMLFTGSLVLMLQAPHGMASTYDFGVVRCLLGFFAGTLTAILWTTGRWRPRGEVVAVAVTGLAVCLLPREAGVLIVPVFAWVVLVFAADAGPVSRMLAARIPQRLGTLSYSIYMVHSLVGLMVLTALGRLTTLTGRPQGVISVVGPWWVSDGISLAYLGVVIAAASQTYRLIERPGQAWFKTFEQVSR